MYLGREAYRGTARVLLKPSSPGSPVFQGTGQVTQVNPGKIMEMGVRGST